MKHLQLGALAFYHINQDQCWISLNELSLFI